MIKLRNSVFLLTSALLTTPLFSQLSHKHNVTDDLDMKSTDNIRIDRIEDSNIFFSFHGREDNKRVVQLYKIDGDMNLNNSVSLGEKLKNYGDLAIDQLISYSDGLVKILAEKNKSDKTIKLYAEKIDADLKSEGNKTEILFLKNVDFKSFDDNKGKLSRTCYKSELINPVFGKFMVSENRKFAAYTADFEEEDDSFEKLHIAVFKGSSMEKFWSKDIEIKHPENLFFIEKTVVSDEGEVLLSGIKFFNKRDVEIKNLPNYKYVLIHISNKGEKVKEYEISYLDNFVSDMVVGFNSENKIICGTWISQEGLSKVSGFMNLIIDPVTGLVKETVAADFAKDFILQNLNESETSKMIKQIEAGEKGIIKELDLDKIIFKSDGGFYLIGEEFEYEEGSTSPMTGVVYDPMFSYVDVPLVCTFGDIVVLSFDKNAKLEWSQKVAKRQKSRGTDIMYCSYAVTSVNDEIALVYNDCFDAYDPEKIKSGKKINNKTFMPDGQNEAALVTTTLTNTGKMKTEMIKEMKKSEGFIQSISCFTNENSMAFFSGINHHNYVHLITFSK